MIFQDQIYNCVVKPCRISRDQKSFLRFSAHGIKKLNSDTLKGARPSALRHIISTSTDRTEYMRWCHNRFPEGSHNITTPMPPLLFSSTLFFPSTPPTIGPVR